MGALCYLLLHGTLFGDDLGRLPSPEVQEVLASTLVAHTASRFTERYAWLLSWGDPTARAEQLERLVHEWSEDDPIGLARCLERRAPEGIALILPDTVANKLRVVKGAENLPPQWRPLLNAFVEVYALLRPRESLAWAKVNLQGPHLAAAMLPICASLARVDANAAASAAIEVIGDQSRAEACRETGASWAERSPESALRWAQAISDPYTRGYAVHGVARTLAFKRPGLAMQAIGEYASNGMFADDALLTVVTVGNSNPDVAMSWASSLHAGRVREVAQRIALRCWARSNPSASWSYFKTHLLAGR